MRTVETFVVHSSRDDVEFFEFSAVCSVLANVVSMFVFRCFRPFETGIGLADYTVSVAVYLAI